MSKGKILGVDNQSNRWCRQACLPGFAMQPIKQLKGQYSVKGPRSRFKKSSLPQLVWDLWNLEPTARHPIFTLLYRGGSKNISKLLRENKPLAQFPRRFCKVSNSSNSRSQTLGYHRPATFQSKFAAANIRKKNYQERNYNKTKKQLKAHQRRPSNQIPSIIPKFHTKKQWHLNTKLVERTYSQNAGPSLELNKINFIKNLPRYPDFFPLSTVPRNHYQNARTTVILPNGLQLYTP